jgi:hypothetical protein
MFVLRNEVLLISGFHNSPPEASHPPDEYDILPLRTRLTSSAKYWNHSETLDVTSTGPDATVHKSITCFFEISQLFVIGSSQKGKLIFGTE